MLRHDCWGVDAATPIARAKARTQLGPPVRLVPKFDSVPTASMSGPFSYSWEAVDDERPCVWQIAHQQGDKADSHVPRIVFEAICLDIGDENSTSNVCANIECAEPIYGSVKIVDRFSSHLHTQTGSARYISAVAAVDTSEGPVGRQQEPQT